VPEAAPELGPQQARQPLAASLVRLSRPTASLPCGFPGSLAGKRAADKPLRRRAIGG
jgi:hypothetical protein